MKYSDRKSLNDQDLHNLTEQLNKSLAYQNIPEEWLDSHLAPVQNLNKDGASIKGYRIVTMQITAGNVFEQIVAS